MHDCTHLITKTIPTEEEILEILAPFQYGNTNENNEPAFVYDYATIGGRWKGEIKLKVDVNDEYYDWENGNQGDKNGRLFLSILLTTLKRNARYRHSYSEESWYSNMGSNDGYILVDGARMKDILNFDDLRCDICILPNGEAFVRNGAVDEEFDAKHKQALADNMDGFLTVLDIHS